MEESGPFEHALSAEHCLARWAARLKIRSLRVQSLEGGGQEAGARLRGAQLAWCERASGAVLCGPPAARALLRDVLRCCRELPELYERETLRWARVKVRALGDLSASAAGAAGLPDHLRLAERLWPRTELGSRGAALELAVLALRLRLRTAALSKENIQAVLSFVKEKWASGLEEGKGDEWEGWQGAAGGRGAADAHALDEAFLIAVSHYDRMWSSAHGMSEREDLISEMYEALRSYRRVRGGGPGGAGAAGLLDVLLARLLQRRRAGGDTRRLANELEELSIATEEYQAEALRECGAGGGAGGVAEGGAEGGASGERERQRAAWRARLALVAHPLHALHHYLVRLLRAAADHDAAAWAAALRQLDGKMFHEHAGPDYLVLDKYRARLRPFQSFEVGDPSERLKVLRDLEREVRPGAAGGGSGGGPLRLARLSPALAQPADPTRALADLLGLPPHLTVYKFDDEVAVFGDSARRPAVLRARLADGAARRWLVKGGDCPRADRAAQALARQLAPHAITTYLVRALSADCALLQFLERHRRLDALVARRAPQHAPEMTDDRHCELDVEEKVRQFRDMCERVPLRALRSAMEEDSVDVEDFIRKRRNFTESLAANAVLAYVIGVGDRHPQNVLVCAASGALAHVDWASAPHAAPRALEPAPARLTRTLLACAAPGECPPHPAPPLPRRTPLPAAPPLPREICSEGCLRIEPTLPFRLSGLDQHGFGGNSHTFSRHTSSVETHPERRVAVAVKCKVRVWFQACGTRCARGASGRASWPARWRPARASRSTTWTDVRCLLLKMFCTESWLRTRWPARCCATRSRPLRPVGRTVGWTRMRRSVSGRRLNLFSMSCRTCLTTFPKRITILLKSKFIVFCERVLHRDFWR
ncbi:uncharacterized protein LOC123699341 [Colias croceus]|uniref:uncharacterized protein LOC123699341 n=1 Tax=Colias crocea TaxID=72248 RepID=UPI001E27FE86|nr:uncharacterized protein LOC123699341 [Colias croceus]